jgi:uncharacterized protein
MKGLFTVFFCIIFCFVFSQNKVENNGYNKFYYPGGQISSEGKMVNGNPDGYWKTYYATGILKSEGNRKDFLLDSLWIFYDESGDTIEKINYYGGKKNGYYYTYQYQFDVNRKKTGGLVSKELFLNEIRQGTSYYYENGKLKLVINYVKGKKHGLSREFDESGAIITLYEYKNDYLIFKEKINRKDNKGLKQGTWKEFYKTDKIKSEANYVNDTLNGYYKEFDELGKMVHIFKFKDGKKLNIDSAKTVNVVVKEEYYSNGKIKFRGSYVDSIPVGIHKYFAMDGSVQNGILYNDIGKLSGEGLVDDNDKKQGLWKFYYESGELLSQGKFSDDKKTGEWSFYYRNGNLEEKGKYNKNNAIGLWKWYYENGKLWRTESYENGKEEGKLVEFAQDSTIINKGEYADGEKEGYWFYHVGDHTEEGNFQAGLKEGLWKYHYSNGELFFVGNFVHDLPNGRHKYFYDNGNLKEQGNYIMGNKEGIWVKYDYQGNIEMTITYKNDNEERVNGIKMTLPKERK